MQIGDLLECTTGTWLNNPTSFAYEWQNSPDMVVWTPIVGAVNNTYRLQRSDTNKYIRCKVTASTAFDSTVAFSETVGPIIDLGFVCQFSTANPNASVQTWQDITPYVLKFSTRRAKQRQLQRFEAASMDISLRNTDRRFDPTYVSGPYYPNLLPLRQIRVGFVLNGVISWVYTGYVERWPQVYQGPTWAEVDLTCVDGFELISNHYLASTYATLTTAQGGNKDLAFTAVQLGFLGNSTTIAYVSTGSLSVSVVGTAITININSGVTTANQILTAVQASVPASSLVTVALAPGSTGVGTPAAFGVTALSGGTFAQQLSGAFIDQIFTYINWNGTRAISPGQTQVQAQAVPNDGSTNAVDQIYSAVATEDGQFFFDEMGRPTFLDRLALASATYNTPMVTFTDVPDNVTTFGYQNVQIDYDKDLIYNDIRATRLNGVTQVSADSTSDSNYFTRTLSLSTLNISDGEAKALADTYLSRYKDPYVRFEPLKLFPGNNVAFWAALLKLDLMNAVTVKRSPPGAPDVISVDVSVIGIEIDAPAGPVAGVTWTLSIDPSGIAAQFFILNDAIYGLLDSNHVGY